MRSPAHGLALDGGRKISPGDILNLDQFSEVDDPFADISGRWESVITDDAWLSATANVLTLIWEILPMVTHPYCLHSHQARQAYQKGPLITHNQFFLPAL